MIYQAAPSIAYVPPVDAVEEFKVVTGAYDAQYGRNGGGVVSMAIKGGTNRLHGSAYEFLKRPSLNATRSPIMRRARRRQLRQARPVWASPLAGRFAFRRCTTARTTPSSLAPRRVYTTKPVVPARTTSLRCPRWRSAAAISPRLSPPPASSSRSTIPPPAALSTAIGCAARFRATSFRPTASILWARRSPALYPVRTSPPPARSTGRITFS